MIVRAAWGAEALFLLTSSDFHAGDGRSLDSVMDIARRARVRRVVLLSSLGVSTGRHPTVLEDAIRQSGVEQLAAAPQPNQCGVLLTGFRAFV